MLKMNMRRVWVYFRAGHGIYLTYMMALSNFVLIFWGLGLKNVSWFTQLFPSLWMFITIFTLLYIPVATAIGYWHYKTQMATETNLQYSNSPIFMEMANGVKEFNLRLERIEKKITELEIVG